MKKKFKPCWSWLREGTDDFFSDRLLILRTFLYLIFSNKSPSKHVIKNARTFFLRVAHKHFYSLGFDYTLLLLKWFHTIIMLVPFLRETRSTETLAFRLTIHFPNQTLRGFCSIVRFLKLVSLKKLHKRVVSKRFTSIFKYSFLIDKCKNENRLFVWKSALVLLLLLIWR